MLKNILSGFFMLIIVSAVVGQPDRTRSDDSVVLIKNVKMVDTINDVVVNTTRSDIGYCIRFEDADTASPKQYNIIIFSLKNYGKHFFHLGGLYTLYAIRYQLDYPVVPFNSFAKSALFPLLCQKIIAAK
jgi:hypothetical protein